MPEAVQSLKLSPICFTGVAAEYQYLEAKILRRVGDVLTSGNVLQGPHVAALEKRLAGMAGRRHGIATGSGTDALFFALVALGIGTGDEVLVPAVSFLASASAVLRTGAQPVFVDVDASCNLDLDRAADHITSRTKAMVFVQLLGGMTDPGRIETFAARYNLLVCEDFAQSLGAQFNGRPAGSTGPVGAVSFDPTKVIGAPGSGGAVVTDSDEIAARIRRLRLHGKQGNAFVELGYNSQLPSLSAAILDLKLDHHAAWTARRLAVARAYQHGLANLPVKMPHWTEAVDHVWHKFVIYLDGRDELGRRLAAAGIPTKVHYATALCREPIFGMRQPNGDFPRALLHAETALSLPIHGHLSDVEIDRVIAAVRGFFD